jgi:hypothetical protein
MGYGSVIGYVGRTVRCIECDVCHHADAFKLPDDGQGDALVTCIMCGNVAGPLASLHAAAANKQHGGISGIVIVPGANPAR